MVLPVGFLTLLGAVDQKLASTAALKCNVLVRLLGAFAASLIEIVFGF